MDEQLIFEGITLSPTICDSKPQNRHEPNGVAKQEAVKREIEGIRQRQRLNQPAWLNITPLTRGRLHEKDGQPMIRIKQDAGPIKMSDLQPYLDAVFGADTDLHYEFWRNEIRITKRKEEKSHE